MNALRMDSTIYAGAWADRQVRRTCRSTARDDPLERALRTKIHRTESSLVDLAMFHHDLQSCTSQRLNKRTSSRATADFFNKIDPCRTQTCFRPDP